MKKMLVALLLPVMASAQSLPENCGAPMAHNMELSAIPQLLKLSRDSAHIVRIETLSDTETYQYLPGKYKIDCYLNVRWSNGATDFGYKFSAWEGRYGELEGEYSPPH